MVVLIHCIYLHRSWGDKLSSQGHELEDPLLGSGQVERAVIETKDQLGIGPANEVVGELSPLLGVAGHAQWFARVLAREDFFKRITLSFFSKYRKGVRWWDFYSPRGMRKDSSVLARHDQNSVKIQSFTFAHSLIKIYLHRPFFMGALIKGIMDLVQMNEDCESWYRSGIVETVFGTSMNSELDHAIMTTSVLSRRIETPEFWVGGAVFLVLPVVLGIVASEVNARLFRRLHKEIDPLKLLPEIGQDDEEIKNKHMFPLGFFYGDLFAFLRGKFRLNSIMRIPFTTFDNLENKTPGVLTSSAADISMIATASSIARLHDRLVKEYSWDNPLNKSRMRQVIRNQVNKLGCFGNCLLPCVSYEDWSIQSKRPVGYMFFSLIAAFFWLVDYHYFRYQVFSIYLLAEWSKNKILSLKNGTFYEWSDDAGDYQTVLTNWSQVNLIHKNNLSQAVSRLFSYNQPVDLLIQLLNSLPSSFTDLRELDFSKQSWTTWSSSDLKFLLQAIDQHAEAISGLDLSQPRFSTVSAEQAAALSLFLHNQTAINRLSLSHLGLENNSVALLANALRASAVQALYLDNAELNNTGLFQWLNATAATLQNISAQNSHLAAIPVNISSLPNVVNLTAVDLSGSIQEAASLQWLVHWLGNHSLSQLDLSRNDFKRLNAGNDLWSAVKQVQNLYLSDNNMDDLLLMAALDAWKNSTFSFLDLSYNRMTVFSIESMTQLVATAKGLSLAYCSELDDRISAIFDWFPASSIEVLNVSGITMNSYDELSLLKKLNGSHVTNLILSHTTRLTEADFITWIMDGGLNGLVELDLSHMSLSNTSLSVLFAAISGSSIERLHLAGTSLEYPIARPIWNDMLGSNSSLTYLDLSDTNLCDDNMLSLVDSLNLNCSLQYLKMDDNQQFNESSLQKFVYQQIQLPDYLSDTLGSYNGDFNYAFNREAKSNSNLQGYSIQGVPVSNETMTGICMIANLEGQIGIDQIQMDSAQLALSPFIPVEGCPAASGASWAFLSPLALMFFLYHLFTSVFSFGSGSSRAQVSRHSIFPQRGSVAGSAASFCPSH